MAIENQKFGKGITLAGGFDLGAKAPLDSRDTVATIEERDAHVTGNRAYEGMLVFVEEDKKTYQYVNETWVEFGFNAEKLGAEIVNDLTTGGETKILSAEQGKVLKGLIDTEAERATAAEKEAKDAADAAQADVDALELVVEGKASQADLDALETLVGTLPTGTAAKDVVEYVNIKTAGIATDAALEELQNQLSGVQGDVADIKADYLTSTDKTELTGLITAEKDRAMEAEKANADAIAAVKEDVDAFFLDADMTESAKDTLKEIQTYINTDAEGAAAMAESIEGVKGRVKAIEDDYLTSADKTELTTAIDGKVAQGDHDTLAGRVTTVEGAVATKAEQAALDEVSGKVTVNEENIAKLTASVGTVADNTTLVDMIATAKQEAIDTAAGDATTKANTAETNATAHADELNTAMNTRMEAVEGAVATKAEQADLDTLIGRVTAEEGKVATLQGEMSTAKTNISNIQTAIGTQADQIAAKAEQSELDAAEERIADVESLANTNKSGLDDALLRIVELEKVDHDHENMDVLVGITSEKVAAWDAAETNVQADWNATEGAALILNKPTLGALSAKDEVAEDDLAEVLAAKLNGKAEQTDLDAAVLRIVALEGTSHTHENIAVLDGITAEKVAAWDAAEQNAKDYVDGLNTAMNARMEAVEATTATAVQNVTVGDGLVATRAEGSNDVTISLSEEVTFVLDCGASGAAE